MNPEIYVFLHRLTFVPHVVCAGFVLAATLGVVAHAAGRLCGLGRDDALLPAIWRDLTPFVLGLAITFGVGPLLFVQLLDGHAFYTAGVLLSHRFMAILPALIVGFYLLYLQKAPWRIVSTRPARLLIPLAALGTFAFTAWSWTELTLLAQEPTRWATTYADGPGLAPRPAAAPRLTIFLGLSLLSLATLTGLDPRARVRAALGPLAAIAAAGAALALLGFALHAPVEGVSLFGLRGAVLLAGLVGVLTARSISWRRGHAPHGATQPLALLALLVALESVAALRDAVRIAHGADPAAAVDGVASAQGFAVFATALLAVGVAIAWALLRVRRDLAPSRPSGSE